MSTLFFIRHSQASFGRGNYDKLSETGMKQAQILGEHLHKINMQFDEIYSGTLVRHRETADGYISKLKINNMPVPEIKIDTRMDEYDTETIFSILSPILKKEKPHLEKYYSSLLSDKKSFHIIFSEVMNMWCSGKYDMKGTATWEEFRSGVFSFMDDMMKKYSSGKNVAVFTSGGPVSTAVMKVLSLDNSKTMLVRDEVANASITRFKYTDRRIMLSTFNEYSHLEISGGKNIITYR
jgi:broad specificity phosphatase PhoE